jgi:hypothetical protein
MSIPDIFVCVGAVAAVVAAFRSQPSVTVNTNNHIHSDDPSPQKRKKKSVGDNSD